MIKEVYQGVVNLRCETRLMEIEKEIREATGRLQQHSNTIKRVEQMMESETKGILKLQGGLKELKDLGDAND